MTKLKEAQESIEVLAGQLAAVQILLECALVEGIKTKTLNEQTFAQIFDQGMLAFQNNKNMSNRESFGAIGVLTSAADTIKRAKEEKIIR